MREALEEMYQSLNEDNLDLMRKAAGGAKQTLKMKDGKILGEPDGTPLKFN